MANRSDYALRRLELRDSDMVMQWRNSDHVRKYMYTDHVILLEEHNKWIKKVLEDEGSEYLIFEIKGVPIGLVSVVDIDRINNKCYWGFYLGGESAPTGSGSIMELLALEYIFEKLKIRKIYCEVFQFNKQVIKLHKKFGFIEEGLFKEHVIKNGVYEDVVSLALFESDWICIKQKIEGILFR